MLLETLVLLSSLVTVLDISPIGEDTKNRLQTVQDGVDNRGEGFVALLEHVSTWDGAVTSLDPPDTAMLLSEPEMFRGSIFVVSGVVELGEALPAPWERCSGTGSLEMKRVNCSGCMLLVKRPWHYKSFMQTPALFYKTISMQGRDNQMRVYPTFVTSNNVIITATKQQIMPFAFLAVALLAFVVFVFYWVVKMTKRKRQLGPRTNH